MDTSKYNYIASLYQFLSNQELALRDKLRKAPGHFLHTSQIEKVKHDIKLLEPLIKSEQAKLNTEVESMTSSKFQFLSTKDDGSTKG